MSIFGEQFYPTPYKIVRKMIEPFLKEGRFPVEDYSILEPSAGKGDICAAIAAPRDPESYRDRGEENRRRITCLEIDASLKAILESKGYTVAGSDFLKWTPQKAYNLVLMNPPFSDGCKHLLHAWNILDEGDIACLLNSETIRNPFSEERQLLRRIIVDNHGTCEDLGDCFAEAERKTGVQITLVRLHKAAQGKGLNFDFKLGGKEKQFSFDIDEQTGLARRDVVGNLIASFDDARAKFIAAAKGVYDVAQAASICRSEHVYGYNVDSVDKAMEKAMEGIVSIATCGKATPEEVKSRAIQSYNLFSDSLRGMCWDYIFSKTKLSALLTQNVRKELDKLYGSYGKMDLTAENIERLFSTLFLSKDKIMHAAVEEAFDLMTDYHKENRIHVEGWKTNDAFMVHRKFILPSILENSYGRYCLGYGYRTNELDDIDRACAYLDGKSIAPIQNANGETIYPVRTIRQTIQADIHAMRGESTYFKLKWYLKGTVHFEFKYEWMWLKLNVMATDGKQWLPGHLKKEYEQKINQLQLKEGTAA